MLGEEARVALIISSLGAGGAERVMTFIANHWAALSRPVILITFGHSRDASFFDVDPRVERIYLDVRRASRYPVKGINPLRQVLGLRRALQEAAPDIAISFIAKTNLLTIIATRGMGVPLVVCDRLDPRAHPLSLGRRILRRLLYPRASRVVTQTDAALAFFAHDIQRRGRAIPNPVPVAPEAGADPPPAKTGRLVIALGRLHEQKGFDLLVRAFQEAHARHSAWALEIWGEGPERPNLERLVDDLGLEGRVRLPGVTTAPYDVLRTADLFVMSSRREGFPNALCEAMACGLPVVSFDCPSGPAEIIRDGVDGVLVPPENVGLLAMTLDRMMSDEKERQRLGLRAVEVTQRFSTARVMALWDQLVTETVRVDRPLPHRRSAR